jgi:cobalt-zinc-cadmium efflux system membrane fusion protein
MISPHRNASSPVRGYVVAATVFLIIGAGLGAGGYRLIAPLSSDEADARAARAKEDVPILVRDGDQVSIPDGSPLRNKLEVAAIATRPFQRTLTLPAVVEVDPARLAKILPPLSGRIVQLKVQLGQRVEAGQPLAVLDSADLRAAYNDHDRAEIAFGLATKVRDRLHSLNRAGGIADKEVQQADADFGTAEAELQRAEARLKQIGVPLVSASTSRLLTIVSPIAGSVIDLAVAPGAFWNDPTAALMTVADLTSIWVTAIVPEKDISFIAEKQAVNVNFAAYPGETLEGHVLFISDVLDADTRRAKVRISFPNPDFRLKPGMFANVTVLAPVQAVLMVRTSAIVLKKDANRVFVETAPWRFTPRQVRTGVQQGDEIVIEDGLKVGDRVVVKGAVLLND